MSRHELARGNKGLWQRIEALVRSTLPRQARVIRTEGSSVWVKFLGDGADDPEAKFPSTVSGVPVATMGWVITLGGKKGLFVVTGIPKVVIGRNYGASDITATTAGTHWNTDVSLTIPDLNPAHEYTVKGDVSIRTTGSTRRELALRFQAIGATTESTYVGPYAATVNQEMSSGSGVILVRPDSNGEIVVSPGFSWASGTVSTNWASITVTIA